MKTRLCALLAVTFATAGCALPQPEEIDSAVAPTVLMAVDPQTNVFRITTRPDPACVKDGENVNGCFEVARNKVVFARFTLANSPDWQLQRIKICLGKNKPTQPCNLSPWNRLEFVAAENRNSEFLLPDTDGVIDLSEFGAGLDSFFLATQNLYERWWYYQLQVCPAGSPAGTAIDDASCRWNEDPPMKNRGRIRF